ncbi:metallophosphoesterase family protein [Aromatoleum petrolei]|uniref:Metallophosphoesterase n=1 Tax=Aromatoleum petrolei TaxID=76116 RepID=A0ABX1MNA9_9RHOO|nr:metallophosphoesterase [Aromatoleum petrolei]NMF87534.1 metallophosphoesterase [Aromatoleum petrolei]QTQ38631.1 Calcineurin-like phosphoesterase domain-containing protein [Aromatoleum petrolei]
MKLQIVSDIHLGLAPCEVPDTGADLLILAGDIHRPREALGWAAALNRPAIYVPGNHEYYGSSIPETNRMLHELSHDSGVTVLDCEEMRIGDVRILGATLWSDFRIAGDGALREQAMDEATRFSRDFSRIAIDDAQKVIFTPQHCAALFEDHANWLRTRLAERFDGTTVVVTHFAPSPRSIAARFGGSPLNACFVSDLETLVSDSEAALWIHGHTHDSFDYRVGGTRVLANPRGYVRDGIAENASFDPGLTVEVG